VVGVGPLEREGAVEAFDFLVRPGPVGLGVFVLDRLAEGGGLPLLVGEVSE
jgi:hypothetical protein